LSEEAPIGLTIMEKLIGLLMVVIGALTFYVTYTNLESTGGNPFLFLTAGIALVVLGVFLVIVRAE